MDKISASEQKCRDDSRKAIADATEKNEAAIHKKEQQMELHR